MKKPHAKPVSSARRIAGIVTAILLMTALLEIAVGNVRAFQVVSRSMEPTLKVGDCVLSIRHVLSADRYGSVVAFEPREPGDALVKRVLAREGQTVQVREGQVYVDGQRDSYSDQTIQRMWRSPEWPISPGELFVVGDNRNNSFDSLDTGPIRNHQVLGVVAFRYWPPERIGLIR